MDLRMLAHWDRAELSLRPRPVEDNHILRKLHCKTGATGQNSSIKNIAPQESTIYAQGRQIHFEKGQDRGLSSTARSHADGGHDAHHVRLREAFCASSNHLKMQCVSERILFENKQTYENQIPEFSDRALFSSLEALPPIQILSR